MPRESQDIKRRNRLLLRAIIILTVASSVCACNRKTVYSHYEHTPIGGWEKYDHLSFTVDSLEKGGVYGEKLGVRINGTYPFKSLTLIIEQTVRPSGRTYGDTLLCRFYDDEGNNLGYGSGFYQYDYALRSVRLQKGDTLGVTVRHNMKREILPGIADIGLTLRRAE